MAKRKCLIFAFFIAFNNNLNALAWIPEEKEYKIYTSTFAPFKNNIDKSLFSLEEIIYIKKERELLNLKKLLNLLESYNKLKPANKFSNLKFLNKEIVSLEEERKKILNNYYIEKIKYENSFYLEYGINRKLAINLQLVDTSKDKIYILDNIINERIKYIALSLKINIYNSKNNIVSIEAGDAVTHYQRDYKKFNTIIPFIFRKSNLLKQNPFISVYYSNFKSDKSYKIISSVGMKYSFDKIFEAMIIEGVEVRDYSVYFKTFYKKFLDKNFNSFYKDQHINQYALSKKFKNFMLEIGIEARYISKLKLNEGLYFSFFTNL